MLAERFARMNEPVRYAVDPAHAQAIRNYLAIASRALQIPGYMGNLLTPGTGHSAVAEQLGNHAGLGRELGRSFLSEHDPASLAGLLDLLGEHGIDPNAPANSAATTTQGHGLARLLNVLHHNVTGYGNRDQASAAHPAVLRGYGAEGLGHMGVRQRIGEYLRTSPGGVPIGNMVRAFQNSVRLGNVPRELSQDIEGAGRGVHHGHALDVVALHDLANHPDIQHIAWRSDVGRRMGELLSQIVHPALWHFGEHGALP